MINDSVPVDNLIRFETDAKETFSLAEASPSRDILYQPYNRESHCLSLPD